MSTIVGDRPMRHVETAAHRVIERIGPPVHERATVAVLESEGLRDADAAQIRSDCEDLFALGHVVHARALELSEAAATLAAPPITVADPGPPEWRRLLRTYRLGIGYSLPLIAMGIGVLVFGISLWGSTGLSAAAKSGMALGVLVSLVMSGPFTYAMTRRIYCYWYQYDPAALARTVYRWTLAAAISGVVWAAIAAGWCAAAGSARAFNVALVAVLLLQGPIWTCTSALYVIGRAWLGGVVLMIPVVPLWLVLRAGAPALPAHLAALTAAVAVLVGATWVTLRRLPGRSATVRAPLPAQLMVVSVGGFAAWGCVYYMLLFGDRLMAWLSPSGAQFAPGYETALDLALVPLVFAMPVLEFTLMSVAGRIEELGESAWARDLDRLVPAIEDVIIRTVGGALVTFAALAGLILIAIRVGGDLLPEHASAAIDHGSGWTAVVVALLAYGFLVLGLGIGTVFQLLSRPWLLVRAGIIGVVANLLVGALARAEAGPQAAAHGLLAGTATFSAVMLFTWWRCRLKLPQWWAAT